MNSGRQALTTWKLKSSSSKLLGLLFVLTTPGALVVVGLTGAVTVLEPTNVSMIDELTCALGEAKPRGEFLVSVKCTQIVHLNYNTHCTSENTCNDILHTRGNVQFN
jgi:hypothetical protein